MHSGTSTLERGGIRQHILYHTVGHADNIQQHPPPQLIHLLKRPFLTDSKSLHISPPRNDILAHQTKSSQNPRKVPEPTVLAHNECPRDMHWDRDHIAFLKEAFSPGEGLGPGIHILEWPYCQTQICQ